MSGVPAAAYVRVSTEDQSDGWSLDGQIQAIGDYAEKKGYEIVAIYRDETSGAKDKRPGFDKMLMDAHAGAFSAIIVYHTSRFFRNIALARRYKDLLRNKLGIEIIFVNQPTAGDPSDPMTFMMEGINELFDEYYIYQLRFWTSLGKRTRAEQGLWNGTLPFGYISAEDGVPVPDLENAQGVKLAFEAYSTGKYSDRGIAELLNEQGYQTTGNWGARPFTKDTVNRLLQNEFYLGYVKYKGNLYPGKHVPLVEQELFDRCQDVRAHRRRKRRSFGHQKRVYVLAGIARCHECELTLRCYSTSRGREWRYYRHTARERGYDCASPGRYIRADVLEPKWAEIVSRIQLPEDWRARIEAMAGDQGERDAILRERKLIQEKLRRLKTLYRDLMIDDQEYQVQVGHLKNRLASLVLPDNPQLVKAGEYLENLGALWEAATLEEQREITVLLLKTMYVDVEQNTITAIEPKPAFRLLLTAVCEGLGVEIL